MNEQTAQHMKVKWASPGLEQLKPDTAGTMELTDGSTVNFGVIRVEPDALVHFTGQGLREMQKPNMNEEEQAEANRLLAILEEPDGEQRLMRTGHVAVTPLARIARVN